MAEKTKVKSITLSTGWKQPNTTDGKPHRYRVETLTDSTAYAPGDFIEQAEVNVLCSTSDWRVRFIGDGEARFIRNKAGET